jgi:peptidoglycan/LPS O-acetylase OafA/YrhL
VEPQATTNARKARTGRLAALDGFRIIAALLVVFYHYVGTQKTNIWDGNNAELFPVLYQASTYGWLGVQFFFMISGFVICMSSWNRSLGEYFVSRSVRLYPVYWFAVLLSAAVVLALPGLAGRISSINPADSLSDILLNLTMLQEPLGVTHIDSVYWTLWIEMRFYLLFALVVWRGATYRRVVLFCVLWLVASLAAAMSGVGFLGALVMPTVAPYFIAGIAFYLMHRFRPTALLWGIVGLCWLITQHQLVGDVRYMNGLLNTSQNWRYAVVLVTLFYLAVAATALGWLSWARWRWLTVAGVLTYPLYLLHQNLGLMFIRQFSDAVPRWVLLPGAVVAALTLSWLAHRLIERPIAPLMKRLLTRSLAEVRELDPRGGPAVGAPDRPTPVPPAQRAAPPIEPAPLPVHSAPAVSANGHDPRRVTTIDEHQPDARSGS